MIIWKSPIAWKLQKTRMKGGFVVFYPDMPGCITCGETVESAVANALDAKKAWFEAYFQNNDCETLMLRL